MCKHILNAQVSIRSPCCLKWFDCFECHDFYMDHPMGRAPIIMFACHSCKMSFRRDLTIFGDKDEMCPHCGSCYVVDAETPELVLFHEINDEMDKMLADATAAHRPIIAESQREKLTTLQEEEKAYRDTIKDEEGDADKAKYQKRKSKLLAKKQRSSVRSPS